MLYSKRDTARLDERDRRDTQLILFEVMSAVFFAVN